MEQIPLPTKETKRKEERRKEKKGISNKSHSGSPAFPVYVFLWIQNFPRLEFFTHLNH